MNEFDGKLVNEIYWITIYNLSTFHNIITRGITRGFQFAVTYVANLVIAIIIIKVGEINYFIRTYTCSAIKYIYSFAEFQPIVDL